MSDHDQIEMLAYIAVFILAVIGLALFFTWLSRVRDRETPTACPHCGHDDIRTKSTYFGQTEIIRSTCPDCHEHWVFGVRQETKLWQK